MIKECLSYAKHSYDLHNINKHKFTQQVPDVTVVGGSHGIEEFRIVTKASGGVEEKERAQDEVGGIAAPASNIACLALDGNSKMVQNGTSQGIPRVWSNPQLSSHLRPGLEPPQLHQTNITDALYEVDLTRGVAVKTNSREASPITPERRQSMPEIG